MVKRQHGYSMIEVMVVISLSALMLTLGAGALRNYWLNQALDGASDEIAAQLRLAQERSVSESHPVIYGVRVRHGSSNYALLRFDPKGDAPDECVLVHRNTFASGVVVKDASFPQPSPAPPEVTVCKTLPDNHVLHQFIFFYARGNATAGSFALHQPTLGTPKDRVITVVGITGRVDAP